MFDEQVIFINNLYKFCWGSLDICVSLFLRQIMANEGFSLKKIAFWDFNFNDLIWSDEQVQMDQKADNLILFTDDFKMKQVF